MLLTVSAAISAAEECGIQMTYQNIWIQGKKYGFIMYDEFDGAVLVRHSPFMAYLKDIIKPIPDGYKKIAQAAKECKISADMLYYWIRKGKIGTVSFGAGKGKLHVKVGEVKEFCRKSRQGYKG